MKELRTCCICGQVFLGWGNNPWPLSTNEEDVCCNECNLAKVIPARLDLGKEETHEE